MRFPIPAVLALAAALPLAAQTAAQVAAGQQALKESLACRRAPETLQPQLEKLGFSPVLVKDTMDFYGRELKRKQALDADKGKFTVGEAPVRGSAGAPVTVLEFSDFECPHCARAVPVVERILREYEGKVRIAHKCFNLPQHAYAPAACAAARAGGAQGKYWQVHDYIFAHQEEIASLAGSDFGPAAIGAGADWNRFKADYLRFKADAAFGARVKQEADAWGVGSTPTFFVNGEKLETAAYEVIKEKIDAALLERQCATPAAKPAAAPAAKRPAAPRPARK